MLAPWILAPRQLQPPIPLPPGCYFAPRTYTREDLSALGALLAPGLGAASTLVLSWSAAERFSRLLEQPLRGPLLLLYPDPPEDDRSPSELEELAQTIPVTWKILLSARTETARLIWLDRHIKQPLLRQLREHVLDATHPLAALGVQHLPALEIAELTSDPLELLEFAQLTALHRLEHAQTIESLGKNSWTYSLRLSAGRWLGRKLAVRIPEAERKEASTLLYSLSHQRSILPATEAAQPLARAGFADILEGNVHPGPHARILRHPEGLAGCEEVLGFQLSPHRTFTGSISPGSRVLEPALPVAPLICLDDLRGQAEILAPLERELIEAAAQIAQSDPVNPLVGELAALRNRSLLRLQTSRALSIQQKQLMLQIEGLLISLGAQDSSLFAEALKKAGPNHPMRADIALRWGHWAVAHEISEDSLIACRDALHLACSRFQTSENWEATSRAALLLQGIDKKLPYYARSAARAVSTRQVRDEIESRYRRRMKTHPDDAENIIGLANFLLSDRGNIEEAEYLFRKAVAMNPQSDLYSTSLAALLQHNLGYTTEVKELLKKSYELAPQRAINASNYARSLLEDKEYEKSIQLIHNAIEMEPTNPNHWRALAFFFTKTGQNSEALSALRRENSLRPGDKSTIGSIANVLSNMNTNLDEAEKIYQNLISIDAKEPNWYGNFAKLLFLQGRKEEAIHRLEEAELLSPVNQELRVELAYYRYAHQVGPEAEALARLKALVQEGARSPGWNFDANAERAVEDGHPQPELVKALAAVLSGREDAATLESFEAWRQAPGSAERHHDTAG